MMSNFSAFPKHIVFTVSQVPNIGKEYSGIANSAKIVISERDREAFSINKPQMPKECNF